MSVTIITVEDYFRYPEKKALADAVLAKVTNVNVNQCYRIEIGGGMAKVYAYKWRKGRPYLTLAGNVAKRCVRTTWP